MACQSETFLDPPWQGSASIRFLWHIGCQSDFDELVSMAFRPVDRSFGRMEETKNKPILENKSQIFTNLFLTLI